MNTLDLTEVYRTYGIKEFNLNKFNKIINREYFNKPYGGLWASPRDTDDWYNWCKLEDYCVSKLNTFIDFRLNPNAKILTIETEEDFNNLIKNYANRKLDFKEFSIIDKCYSIDWEKVAKHYDGFKLIQNDYTYYAMYGWDVTTLLGFNPDVIELL